MTGSRVHGISRFFAQYYTFVKYVALEIKYEVERSYRGITAAKVS